MSQSPDLTQFVLRLGDNCLVLSQRLIEWCGIAPELEEDVALSNVALDLLGQARMWLDYAGRLEGAGRDENKLAFWRDDHEFLNLQLVELPNENFAQSQIRQFFFDAWHLLVLNELRHSSDETTAAIAAKAIKEVCYHLRRSRHWVERLGDGTILSHRLTQNAIDDIWDYSEELFEVDSIDERLLAQGIGCDFASLREPWFDHVRDTLVGATLHAPNRQPLFTGGRRGRHTEHLSPLLAEMQFLQRANPGAEW
jgi:ring-1,2-phenylacetyl-CoA epoxidase subunit PaaC